MTSLGLVSFRRSNVCFLWRQSTQFRGSSTARSRKWWPALAWFRLEVPTYVISDASLVGVGVILQQDQWTGERKQIAYISRPLTSTERRYNANTADSLSRLPSNQIDFSGTGFVCEDFILFVFTSNTSDLQAVTLSDMRSETSKDIRLSQLLVQIQSGKWSLTGDLKPHSAIRDELFNFDGIVLRGNRIVVPESLRKKFRN